MSREELQNARIALGLSLREVAAVYGCSRQAIHDIEHRAETLQPDTRDRYFTALEAAAAIAIESHLQAATEYFNPAGAPA